jgi:ribosomal protein S18 acetylase RimI-like enzyme
VSAAVEARPTIDRRWLERVAALDPLTHAYALWDLDRTPQAVRFVSALLGEETVGYLLVWLGRRDRPVVHWFGEPGLADVLVPGFPAPPFVAVVPPEVAPVVLAAFSGGRSSPLKLMLREPGELGPPATPVRRLRREDRAEVTALVRGHPEPELAAYLGLDPEGEPAWGAFDGRRLVGVARAAVRLPRLWVIGGVFVVPEHRGQGLGAALVSAVVASAEAHGARVGLYVRDDPDGAFRLYERLGFREVGRRAWLDVSPPPKR